MLDAPKDIEFGIDNTYWLVGSKFKGISGIPFGPHFIYYALKEEKYNFKIGYFTYFSEKNRV